MARGANLRLSGAVLGQLANPNFARAAGMSIGAGMLGAQRREEEADYRATEEVTLELLRKAQVAQEQGDMTLHSEIVDTFDGMLTGNKYQKTRQLLTDALTTVGGQRAATQTQQQTNTARSILQTEQALEQYQNQVGPLSDQELAAQKALQQRLGVMRENAEAVVEANNMALEAEIKKFEDEDRLYTAKTNAVVRGLGQVQFGSEEYESVAKKARAAGFGKAVDGYEKVQRETEQSRLEIEALRRDNNPLNDKQMQELKDLGISVDDPYLAKPIYISMKSKEAEAKVNLALSSLVPASEERAVGVAQGALAQWSRRGNISSLWFDDLAEKIQEMPDEKQQELFNRVNGLAEVQIEQEVIDFLRSNFPQEFKDLETTEQNVRDEETDKQSSIDMAMAAINFEKGLKPGDADYLDPTENSDRALVWDRIQKDRTTRTLEKQVGVTGRTEARPISMSSN